jgi:hypothetical protein
MRYVILGTVLAACVLAFGGAARAVEPPPAVPVLNGPETSGYVGIENDLAAWVHKLAGDAEALARKNGELGTRLDPNLAPQAEVEHMELLEDGAGFGFAGLIIGIAVVASRRRRRRTTVISHSRRRLGQTFTIDCSPSFDGGEP